MSKNPHMAVTEEHPLRAGIDKNPRSAAECVWCAGMSKNPHTTATEEHPLRAEGTGGRRLGTRENEHPSPQPTRYIHH